MAGARTRRIGRIADTAELGWLCRQLAKQTKIDHQGAVFHVSQHDMESVWFVTPFTQNRDSDPLQESNYQVIFKDLQRVSPDGVTDHRMGDWGHGWFEQIYVRKDDAAALRAVQGWINALANYPVADDEHYSALEWERNHPNSHLGECYCDDDDCSVRLEACPGVGYSCYEPSSERPSRLCDDCVTDRERELAAELWPTTTS